MPHGLLPLILESYRAELDIPEGVAMTPTTRDEFGVTPLHAAARLGEIEHVKAFLGAGAPVNLRGEEGATPLHDAAGYGWVEVVKALLEAGADAGLVDEDGFTPAEIARQMEQEAAAEVIEGWG